MNLILKPDDIKQHIEETKINRHFEGSDEVKSASFFKITLTHITTGITVNTSGYNKIDVFTQSLKMLNDYVIAKQFESNIPFNNIKHELKESNSIVK